MLVSFLVSSPAGEKLLSTGLLSSIYDGPRPFGTHRFFYDRWGVLHLYLHRSMFKGFKGADYFPPSMALITRFDSGDAKLDLHIGPIVEKRRVTNSYRCFSVGPIAFARYRAHERDNHRSLMRAILQQVMRHNF